MYTITAEVSNSNGRAPVPHILVKADATGHMFSDVFNFFGTNRLFSIRDTIGSPIQLRILGGVACASSSSVAGQALSLCKQST